VADHRHGVVALEPADLDNIPPLPHGDDRRVATEPGWIYANDDGRRVILMFASFHGFVHQG
jgi:hypothetical protein